MRGKTLGQLVSDLAIRAGLDPNPALYLAKAPQMRLALKDEQERLYDDFDWPFLRIHVDVPTSAGERYYDVPNGMNLERIERVEYKWADRWLPLERGITSENYNVYDSDADVRMEPAFRYDILDTGGSPQVEIWPIPLSDGNPIRYTGIRKLAPFLVDSDRADLDDQVLIGLVAAEMISNQKRADEVRQKALTRLHTLRGLVKQSDKGRFNMNGAQPTDQRFRTPLVAYVRNQ